MVVSIPGASAMLAALAASGLSTERFVFEGFLPRKQNQRQERLRELAKEDRTMVFYEAPHRLLATLQDMRDVFGAARKTVAARELTKKFEEFLRLDLGQMLLHFQQTAPKGEFVLLLAGAEKAGQAAAVDEKVLLTDRLALEKQGMSRKTAAKMIAKEYGQSANDIYRLGLYRADGDN